MGSGTVWSNEIRELIVCSFCNNCYARYSDKKIEVLVKVIAPKTEQAWLKCKSCQKEWGFKFYHDYSEESEEIELDELIIVHEILNAPEFDFETITKSKKKHL